MEWRTKNGIDLSFYNGTELENIDDYKKITKF